MNGHQKCSEYFIQYKTIVSTNGLVSLSFEPDANDVVLQGVIITHLESYLAIWGLQTTQLTEQGSDQRHIMPVWNAKLLMTNFCPKNHIQCWLDKQITERLNER